MNRVRAGQADRNLEARILFLVDQLVFRWIGAEAVSINQTRAIFGVVPDIEQRFAVGRPGEVRDTGNLQRPMASGGDVAHTQVMALVAGHIDQIGEQPVIGAVLLRAEREKGLASRERGYIEQQLLGAAVARRAHDARVLGAAPEFCPIRIGTVRHRHLDASCWMRPFISSRSLPRRPASGAITASV